MPQYNTFKQRIYLYRKSFMKWAVERRLSTLQQTAIETSLAVHKFGNNPSEVNFTMLAQSLSDVETMIEVAELGFPDLRAEMNRIKKEKLNTLYETTKEKEKEKAESAKKKPEMTVSKNEDKVPKVEKTAKKKRSILDLFRFFNN